MIPALHFPKFTLDDDEPLLSVEWDGGPLTYAQALQAVGIAGAVSRQYGPAK